MFEGEFLNDKIPERELYLSSVNLHTIDAFNKYKNSYLNGFYIKEVDKSIKELEKVQKIYFQTLNFPNIKVGEKWSLSSNGVYIASRNDKDIDIYSVANKTLVFTYKTKGKCSDFKLSNNGRYLAVLEYMDKEEQQRYYTYYFNITIVDVEKKQLEKKQIKINSKSKYTEPNIENIEFSNNGTYFLISTKNGTYSFKIPKLEKKYVHVQSDNGRTSNFGDNVYAIYDNKNQNLLFYQNRSFVGGRNNDWIIYNNLKQYPINKYCYNGLRGTGRDAFNQDYGLKIDETDKKAGYRKFYISPDNNYIAFVSKTRMKMFSYSTTIDKELFTLHSTKKIHFYPNSHFFSLNGSTYDLPTGKKLLETSYIGQTTPNINVIAQKAGNYIKLINYNKKIVGKVKGDQEKKEDKYYSNAKKGNSSDCKEYLEKYPKGRYANEISELEFFYKSREKNDYSIYHKKYPNGHYTDDIENIFYRAAKEGTEEDCNNYLKEYPKGKYVSQVKERKLYIEIKYADKTSDFDRYLNKYPSGEYYSDIKDRKKNLNAKLERKRKIKANSDIRKWDLGLKICRQDYRGIVMGSIEQWNSSKSRVQIKIAASPGGLTDEGDKLTKGNTIWINPKNGWHLCLPDEKSYALSHDKSADFERYTSSSSSSSSNTKKGKFEVGESVSYSFSQSFLFITNDYTIRGIVVDWNGSYTKMKIKITDTDYYDGTINNQTIYNGAEIWVSTYGWK